MRDSGKSRNTGAKPGAGLRAAATGLTCLLAAVVLAGCGEGTAGEVDSVFGNTTVERGSVVASVAATGVVEPVRLVEVKSQAGGEVLELAVELGDRVERGDLLIRIDPRDVRNAYEQAQADLEVARARHEVAQRRLERSRTLRDSAVVTDEELEEAILNHADAQSSLVRAEANLELARDRVQDATLRAPITGTVVEKLVEEGQVVTSTREVTGGTELLRMADLEVVQVRTLVDETDIGRVLPGMTVELTVEAYPDRTFEGEVLKIEPQAVVEENVTHFAVLSRIDNEEGLLKPGMNADVEIVTGEREEVLTISNAAVKTPEEARRLARALGMDPELLDEAMRQRSSSGGGADAQRRERQEASARDADDDGRLPSPERLAEMSPDERRDLIGSLEPAQRRQLMERMREMREAEQMALRRDPGRERPAFVFQMEEGRITVRPVTIGLSDWERTEVRSGLEEGDAALEIPMSLIQQQDLLNRVRQRTGVPGVSRN